jgi:hypothetical protein
MRPNSIVNWFVALFAELNIAGCAIAYVAPCSAAFALS